jgi:uncharacterized protein YifE (UPF0438 family)
MSTKKTTVASFINQFVALVTGDDVQVKAEKVWRQASNALKAAIPSAEGDTIAFEDAVEVAVDNLNKARINNGQPITDRSQYVVNVLRRHEALEIAQENLELHLKKVAILKAELETLSAEE